MISALSTGNAIGTKDGELLAIGSRAWGVHEEGWRGISSSQRGGD